MKNNLKTLIVTIIAEFIPTVIGLCMYSRLPEKLVTHWNSKGEADGWSPKAFALFVIPLILAGASLLIYFFAKIDPKTKNINDKIINITLWMMPVISIVTGSTSIAYSLGYDVNVTFVMTLIIGLMFIFIGNYLPKTKQSYTVGIKLPWTLNSEENWNRTHRLGGFISVGCGIAFIAFALFNILNVYVYIAIIIAMVLILTVYSYILYTKGI